MPPAARVTDVQACIIHLGGAIVDGEQSVLIGGLPAARFRDSAICAGSFLGVNIASGSPTVLIGKEKAARIGDTTCHGGKIVSGCSTVIIGNSGGVRSGAVNLAKAHGAPFVRTT